MRNLSKDDIAAINKLSKITDTFGGIGMPVGLQRVLFAVALQPQSSIRELVDHTEYSQAGVSRYVQDLTDLGRMKNKTGGLEGRNDAMGLLKSEPNPFSPREKQVSLTNEGVTFLKNLVKVMNT